jgi:hypothetical protein
MKSTCHNSPLKLYKNGYYCPVCFKVHDQRGRGIRILYLGFALALMVGWHPVKAPSIPNTIDGYSAIQPHTYAPDDIIPSDKSVLEELVKHKCVLASVAVAQARIESGNYTSDIAVNNRNLFGIKVHKCKYVSGERKGHATFATYKDNIACYCGIQMRYLGKIDKAYAEDSLYCQKVKEMK